MLKSCVNSFQLHGSNNMIVLQSRKDRGWYLPRHERRSSIMDFMANAFPRVCMSEACLLFTGCFYPNSPRVRALEQFPTEETKRNTEAKGFWDKCIPI
jgi:hypothetical protein